MLGWRPSASRWSRWRRTERGVRIGQPENGYRIVHRAPHRRAAPFCRRAQRRDPELGPVRIDELHPSPRLWIKPIRPPAAPTPAPGGVSEVVSTVAGTLVRGKVGRTAGAWFTSLPTSFPQVSAISRARGGQVKFFTPQGRLHLPMHSLGHVRTTSVGAGDGGAGNQASCDHQDHDRAEQARGADEAARSSPTTTATPDAREQHERSSSPQQGAGDLTDGSPADDEGDQDEFDDSYFSEAERVRLRRWRKVCALRPPLSEEQIETVGRTAAREWTSAGPLRRPAGTE